MNGNGQHLRDGIRKKVLESGKVSYEAEAGTVMGTRIRKSFGETFFGSEIAALAAATNWLKAKKAEIRTDRKSVVSMSDHERLMFLEAMRKLEPWNKTVLEAVEDAIESYKNAVVVEELSFGQAAKRYYAHKEKENCRPSYLNTIHHRLSAMSEFEPEPLEKVTHREIIEFLEDREINAVSWNNWRRDLGVFFKFCLLNQWIAKDPTVLMPYKKVDEKEVEILEVAQVRALLSGAMVQCPRQIPWLVLGLFCGLRRSEADNLAWSDVIFETNTLRVKAAKLRSVSTRYVELTEPALAFLRSLPQDGRPFVTEKYARRADLRKLSEATGIECNKNLYRHSFGSYHLARWENTQKTMIQMGHENLQTFVRFYRRPIPKLVAQAYWLIAPDQLIRA